MTRTTDWMNTLSWERTVSRYPLYRSRETGKTSFYLGELIKEEATLTLDLDHGFKEIEVIPARYTLTPQKREELTPQRDPSMTREEHASGLIDAAKEYLRVVWDGDRPHLIFCSGGMDSRIISLLLKELREENGREWMGHLHFRCHEPEGVFFKRMIRKQGWRQDEYSILKEGNDTGSDYYFLGDFTTDVNAYYRPAANFWYDLYPPGEEKNVVLIMGLMGGEQHGYPIIKQRSGGSRLDDFFHFGRASQFGLSRIVAKWGEVYFPFMDYEYVKRANAIPEEHLTMVMTPHGQQRDAMRTEIVRLLGNKDPFFIGHRYNLMMSSGRIEAMKTAWLGSKLYRDFQHESIVRDARPWEAYGTNGPQEIMSRSVALKLFGLATTYEGVRS